MQQIAEFSEHMEALANAQHECKFHPEAKKVSCDEFTRLLNDLSKRESALLRSCECKKLEKVA